MPRRRGNPLEAPQRDSLPLERIAVYEQQTNQPVMETDWARIWINRVRRKFELRTAEANSNVGLRIHLMNLLNAAEQVSILLRTVQILNEIQMCTEQDMWIKVPNHSQTRKAMQFIPWQNTETQVNILYLNILHVVQTSFLSLVFMSIYSIGYHKLIFLSGLRTQA